MNNSKILMVFWAVLFVIGISLHSPSGDFISVGMITIGVFGLGYYSGKFRMQHISAYTVKSPKENI